MEGRRDPDAAPSARGGPARAAEGSFAVDVAGPGVAGHARRDAASQAVAAMRLIVTPVTILRWHRDIVRRRWARLSRRGRSGRRRCAVMSGRWCCGWPAENESWGDRRSTESSRCSASGWLHRRCGRSSRTPGSAGTAPGRSWWRCSCDRRRRGSWRWDFFTADLLNGTKVYVLAVIEHGTRRIRSWAPRSTRSSPGLFSRPGTCSWTWKMPERGEVRPA